MKKYLSIISVFVLLSLAGCAHKQSTNKVNKTSADKNSAMKTLNWPGVYFATLPCASCPGINTLLVLNDDGTFEKNVDYLGDDAEPETIKGQLKWSDNGNIVSLDGDNYLVGENTLSMLDTHNQVNTGTLKDFYTFQKTVLALDPDSNDNFYLQQFTDKKANTYNVIFNTNTNPPTAVVQTKKFEKVLTQTEAWAKGAEYKGNGMTLIVKGQKATLTVKGKKITLLKL